MHGGVLGEMRPEWPLGAMAGGPGHTPRHPEVGSVVSTGEASGSRGPPRGPGDGRDVLLQRTPRGLVLWQRRVTRGTNARDSPQPSREMPHTCEGPGAPRRRDGPSRSLPGFLSRPHPRDAVPGWALTPASPSLSAPSVVARTPLSGFSRCRPPPRPRLRVLTPRRPPGEVREPWLASRPDPARPASRGSRPAASS